MAFIQTIPAAEATDDVRKMYAQEAEGSGFVPNYVKAFSLRPEVWDNYGRLIGGIRSNIELRRYELVSVAAALAAGSSYCALAHGKVLRDRVFGAEQTAEFARDFGRDLGHGPLTPAETAMVEFVRKLVTKAATVTRDDVGQLRGHGFSDVEIFDIAAAASARCFFTKLLDALGVEPDQRYADMEPALRQVLVVGRPIETSRAA